MLTILVVGNSTTLVARRPHDHPPGVSHVILLLGGTSDARTSPGDCAGAATTCCVSAASDYGARLAAAAGAAGPQRRAGRGRAGASSSPTPTPSWMPRIPSPTIISGEAMAACARVGRPYLRVERPAGELHGGDGRVLPPRTPRRRRASRGAGTARRRVTAGRRARSCSPSAARPGPIRRDRARGTACASSHACCPPRRAWRPARRPAWSRATSIAMQGPTSAELDAALLASPRRHRAGDQGERRRRRPQREAARARSSPA